MAYIKINHEIDPRQKILDDIGDISNTIEISNNNVLVAVYQRPTTTMLGGQKFYVADKVVDEDRFQSKVGLIVAAGPTAFKDPDGTWWQGIEFNLHDWAVIPPSAAQSMLVNGVMCRLVADQYIKCRVTDPDVIY